MLGVDALNICSNCFLSCNCVFIVVTRSRHRVRQPKYEAVHREQKSHVDIMERLEELGREETQLSREQTSDHPDERLLVQSDRKEVYCVIHAVMAMSIERCIGFLGCGQII